MEQSEKEEPGIQRKQSEKEQKIRKITSMYYSKPKIQKAIFNFAKNREVVPRYFEGFGKRPDTLQYEGDVFELVKKGATSFHCSEELWSDPLSIETGMKEKQLDELRKGWDLLLDIDSKYLDYSKIMAQLIIKLFRFHGIKNFSIKFSGSKGFHLILPWEAFPKKIFDNKTSDMFPLWPRIVTQYINRMIRDDLVETITDLTRKEKGISKYVKDFQAPKEVMPDLILVSSRHLFRMPYSLHEKTRLASIVLPNDVETLGKFQPKDADPLKLSEEDVKDFYPEAEEGEASELLREALDWYKAKTPEEKSFSDSGQENKNKNFQKINLQELPEKLSEKYFPESIKRILKGLSDGRKRAVFILINFFRSVDMPKEEMERRLKEWNDKNEIPLKEGYIRTQLSWAYRKKPILPPNYDKDYYKAIGINPTEEELRYKNPVNYTVKKLFQASREKGEKKGKGKKKVKKKKTAKK